MVTEKMRICYASETWTCLRASTCHNQTNLSSAIPPPPLPISCLPQVPPANYQIPPAQAQSSDVGKILNEVLNRLNDLDFHIITSI